MLISKLSTLTATNILYLSSFTLGRHTRKGDKCGEIKQKRKRGSIGSSKLPKAQTKKDQSPLSSRVQH